MKNEKAYTVTQVSKYIKALFDEDFVLKSVRIKGEISNYNRHSSGHLYFTLKDTESAISCVLFSSDFKNACADLRDGVSVVVTGSISVFVKNGKYQIYVKSIEPEGYGHLYLKFEVLKTRLLKEGLFDNKHKKPLPKNPSVIAVVTSPTGAAVMDIISVARRRNKFIKLAVFPVLVQGGDAAASIEAAIYDINRSSCADIIIVGRGGGSIEDLWAFNEEIVARAIFASKIPVISAVGHETDFTIADFTADIRAATPSVSAEIAVPLLTGKKEAVYNLIRSIEISMADILHEKNEKLLQSSHSLYKLAEGIVTSHSLSLLSLTDEISGYMDTMLEKKENGLIYAIDILEAVSPLSVLKRGYSLSYKDGSIIKTIDGVKEGDKATTALIDGEFDCTVVNVKRNNNYV